VAGNRASAQREKLDAQAEARSQQEEPEAKETIRKSNGKHEQRRPLAHRRANTTIAHAIEDYLQDHAGGNHSDKTLEWHRTALGLMRSYLEQESGIILVGEVDAPDISAWFAHMRTSPGGHGKPRSERTIQTIEAEEFERLLVACTPSNESGLIADRAAARNRAILWVLYDTGIRISELCGLRKGHFDRKRGLLTVTGKGSKERRIALGNNCLRNLVYYLDKHRPDEEVLADWGSAGEDHLFLSETRTPLTKNGVTLLFARLRKRAGITDKRISAHILRHSFAIRYLVLGNDPFSLQELLGHEDMTTVKNYMHMNDETIQAQKRKYSPGIICRRACRDRGKRGGEAIGQESRNANLAAGVNRSG
jgi:site-specific recombinase XerD